MLNIAIVEDEVSMQNQIQEYLQRFSVEQNTPIKTFVFSDGDGIIHNYQPEYDIILMDIQMKFLDGMLTAEMIREKDSDVIIIFISNMENYAIRGYEVNALDFILKPVQYFSFSQKLSRAIRKLDKKEDKSVILQIEGGAKKIKISDICYIESEGHKLIYYLTQETVVKKNATLRDAEELFLPFHFFRCNKGYLVNLAHVDEIVGNIAVVNGHDVLISRGKQKPFLDAFYEYIGNQE